MALFFFLKNLNGTLLGCSKRDIRKGGLIRGGCKLDNVPRETFNIEQLKATNITNSIIFATLNFTPLLGAFIYDF